MRRSAIEYVEAKNLRKGDRLSLSGLSLHVVSNKKNDFKDRVLTLHTNCGHHKELLVIIPRNLRLSVTEHKFKTYPKNR